MRFRGRKEERKDSREGGRWAGEGRRKKKGEKRGRKESRWPICWRGLEPGAGNADATEGSGGPILTGDSTGNLGKTNLYQAGLPRALQDT